MGKELPLNCGFVPVRVYAKLNFAAINQLHRHLNRRGDSISGRSYSNKSLNLSFIFCSGYNKPHKSIDCPSENGGFL
eukprot:EC719267.1.p2 GENE.EC719267.1~~EC719267.1.p2  ORF type:complete len:77 (-),score=1.84 EC719267.1:76-306(-)